MNRWIKGAAAAAAVALGLGAAQAQASIIDWTLSDGTFDDGGTFSGSFSFDDVTDTITQWNVATTFGDGSAAASYSSPGGCVFIFCSSASDNGSGPTFGNSVFIFDSTFELTNIAMGAPGFVAVLTGDESGVSGFPFSFIPFSHTVTAGTATGVLAAPEPAAWGLMLAGFGLAGATLRARRRLVPG
jgi:hypothetical protein